MLQWGPDQMSRTVTIEREELNGVHEFVLRIDGERRGFLEFTRPDVGVMRIEYVEVSPELRGSGVGKQLVEKAVAFATEASLRVVPICSYARAVIQRDPAMSAALK
jgi:predicted GNAT family acetyltransferase